MGAGSSFLLGFLLLVVILFTPGCLASTTALARWAPQAEVAPPSEAPVPTATAEPTATILPPSTATPMPTPTTTPTPEPAAIKANELGRIPIFEYHLISDTEGRWSRTYNNFRRDLERLYHGGYALISLNDLVENNVAVPAGRSPAVLTFDDSSPGQFKFVLKDGKLVPDENSAVGIMKAFNQEHPDFGLEATFYVLPGADPPHDLFGQKEYQKDKLRYIVANGMDIGNHTYWHQALGDLGDAEVQKQLGLAVRVIKEAVPDYQVTSLALPLGIWPRNKALAKSGSYQGVAYRNKAILLVGAEPAPSPNAAGFDVYALPRIQAIQEQMDLWLDALNHNPTYARYVSDGNPDVITFPRAAEKRFNPQTAAGKTVRMY